MTNAYRTTPSPVMWFGGKTKLSKWLIPQLEEIPHTIFVDAFGGAGTVILNKKPVEIEVYNDLNGYLVNLYRVIQHPKARKALQERLKWTLYSRAEFAKALHIKAKSPQIGMLDKPNVNLAWAIMVIHNMGFSGKANSIGDFGIAKHSTNGISNNYNNWLCKLNSISKIYERMKGVQVNCRDALEVIRQMDTANTLHYLDPPYPLETRKGGRYEHELTLEQHEKIVDTVLALKGKVAISSYEHDVYNRLLEHGWRVEKVNRKAMFGRACTEKDNSAKNNPELYARTECLYLNYSSPQLKIF